MWARVVRINDSLDAALLRLQPLVSIDQPRVLLASTSIRGWTAVFDGNYHGHGVDNLVTYLARALRIQGYFIASTPPASGPERPMGGRQFYVLDPKRWFSYIRMIWLIEESAGRWDFDTFGEIQPYEDVKAYRRRRHTDRFTERMLVDYAAAVGLHPWDDSFYRPPFHLVIPLQRIRDYCCTLAQARAEIGLDKMPDG